jgi:hypothetical protein
VANLAGLRGRHRRAGAQHHQQGSHPWQARRQKDAGVKARRRALAPRKVEQGRFEQHQEVA